MCFWWIGFTRAASKMDAWSMPAEMGQLGRGGGGLAVGGGSGWEAFPEDGSRFSSCAIVSRQKPEHLSHSQRKSLCLTTHMVISRSITFHVGTHFWPLQCVCVLTFSMYILWKRDGGYVSVLCVYQGPLWVSAQCFQILCSPLFLSKLTTWPLGQCVCGGGKGVVGKLSDLHGNPKFAFWVLVGLCFWWLLSTRLLFDLLVLLLKPKAGERVKRSGHCFFPFLPPSPFLWGPSGPAHSSPVSLPPPPPPPPPPPKKSCFPDGTTQILSSLRVHEDLRIPFISYKGSRQEF